MILFLAGMAAGALMVMFVFGLIAASDLDDEHRADQCRGCPYEDYSGGLHDCEKCHGVDDR